MTTLARTTALLMLSAASLIAASSSAYADGPTAAAPASSTYGWTVRPATTARDAMQEAIGNLPLNRLRPEVAGPLRDVVREPSIYRRMPAQTIPCDPDLFVYAVRNPDAVVNIWEIMGVNGVILKRTGEYSFTGTDGEGTTANVSLAYGTREMHLYVFDGAYEGTLFRRKVTGHGAALLRTQYGVTQAGKPCLTNTLDVFVKFDNLGADLAAKTLHPLFGATVDTNFLESGKFLARLSESGERNGRGLASLAERLTKVDPAVRKKLSDIGVAMDQRVNGGERSVANTPVKSDPAKSEPTSTIATVINKPRSAPTPQLTSTSSRRTTTASAPPADSSSDDSRTPTLGMP